MDKMEKVLMMHTRTFSRLTTPKNKVLTSIEGDNTSILGDDTLQVMWKPNCTRLLNLYF